MYFLFQFQGNNFGDNFPLVFGLNKSWWQLPPSLLYNIWCSIDLFVHLPILSSDPALAVCLVTAYSAGELSDACKVTRLFLDMPILLFCPSEKCWEDKWDLKGQANGSCLLCKTTRDVSPIAPNCICAFLYSVVITIMAILFFFFELLNLTWTVT